MAGSDESPRAPGLKPQDVPSEPAIPRLAPVLRLAAEARADARGLGSAPGPSDAATLSAYERAWRAELADEFEAQQELREVATALSDTAIDSFFELAHTDGIMPIVRATARFNRHRDLIRALFRHPPARRQRWPVLDGRTP